MGHATRYELVYVIAGAGYGKTRAVWQHTRHNDGLVVRWMQLGASDNICSRFWEKFVSNISDDNPELAEKLRELGFPETLARFKQFASIIESLEHRSLRPFLIFDDFHLIGADKVLKFIERNAYMHFPGACMIIISKKEPGINAVPLFAKGKACVVTEEALRFTAPEIAAFLRHRNIAFSSKNLPQFMEATKGWALAIQLLSQVLKRAPSNLGLALDAMKQNVFKLIEKEAFDDFPEDLRKNLVRLSLVSDLPLASLRGIFGDISFLHGGARLTSFVWFDSFAGDYKIHPLYLEFLQSKTHSLSREETEGTYLQAAEWCAENDFRMDAVYYFSRLRKYGRILEVLLSYPCRLPQDMSEYFLGILEGLNEGCEADGDTDLLILKNIFVPLLMAGQGRYEEARDRALAVIEEWGQERGPLAPIILYYSYGNLAYIDMYICVVTHDYGAPAYLEKCAEYFKRLPSPPAGASKPFNCPDIRSCACLVGEGARREDFDRFLEATGQTAALIPKTGFGLYGGYDDLARCEFAFFLNRPDTARVHALRAVSEARGKKQYSIESMALLYLLRISMLEGDLFLTREVLKQLRDQLDCPDFWNRRLLYDLFTGYFFAQTGIPQLAPPWLISNEKDPASDIRIPNIELFVCAKCYMASYQYRQALTILNNSSSREAHERFLFGELTFSLLTAVARLKTGDEAGAVSDFERAFILSYDGEFETPFVELGKDMQPLIAAVSARAGSCIPKKWLATIALKASVYAKKIKYISDAFKQENNMDEPVQLSIRERQALRDLYYGLSREEMAASRYLSINTVKKVLQSLYTKLGANNNVDAVRIALDKNLLN